jgi:hypothetical protein
MRHINIWTIVIICAVIYLFGGGYGGWYGQRYRPYGFGGGGLLLAILIVLWLTGNI